MSMTVSEAGSERPTTSEGGNAAADAPPRRRPRPAPRVIAAMLASPRCGARTRSGAPCRAPAAKGKARCRKHGGAAGSGARPRNRNAHKHGLYSTAEKTRRRGVMELIKAGNQVIDEIG